MKEKPIFCRITNIEEPYETIKVLTYLVRLKIVGQKLFFLSKTNNNFKFLCLSGGYINAYLEKAYYLNDDGYFIN